MKTTIINSETRLWFACKRLKNSLIVLIDLPIIKNNYVILNSKCNSTYLLENLNMINKNFSNLYGLAAKLIESRNKLFKEFENQ